MSWRAIARKDFLDAVRSRTLWGLLVVFAGLLLVLTYAGQLGEGADLDQFVEFTAAGFAMFVPLVAIVLGYKSVVDERESGTIALLLSFPHTRRDVVVGKFVGRSVVLAVPVVVGLVVASGLLVFLYDSFPLVEYLLFALASVALGLAFLAIAVGLSTTTTSSRRVTTAAFGAYLLFGVLWGEVIDVLLLVLWRFDTAALTSPPDWSLFARMASPAESFNRLVTALFDVDAGGIYTGAGTPWFVDAWVAVLLLLGWVALPLGLGYLRFSRVDL